MIAVGGLALVSYVLTSSFLVGSRWFRSLMLGIPFGDVYLHNPGRLRYVVVLALPILRPPDCRAGGTTALAAAGSPGSEPPSACSSSGRSAPVAAPFGSGCSPWRCWSAPVLFGFATRSWRWASATALVGLVAIELVASAVYAQAYEGGTVFTGLETGEHPALVPQVLRFPSLSEDDYLVAHRSSTTSVSTRALRHLGATRRLLREGVPVDEVPSTGRRSLPAEARSSDPRRPRLQPRPAPATGATSAARTSCPSSTTPRSSTCRLPRTSACRVRYLVVPTGIDPPVAGRVVEEADGYSLWELHDSQPLSTVTSMVEFVDDLSSAMDEVTTSGFDPAEEAVIEPSTDVFTCVGDCPHGTGGHDDDLRSELVIRVPESEGGILTIRNAYEAGWRATVDGRAATTIPVDGFLQGVVSPGAREVILTYHDDAVTLGLALGAGGWLVLLSAPIVALAFERRRREGDEARPTRSPPPDA